MKRFILNNWPIVLILALSGLIVWPLFIRGYFSHHDNLQVMRIFEMRKCFTDLQIPCRWVPDMGYGNGYPLFNFYGPLAYYIGAAASFVLGYIGAAKLLFFLPLVFGGLGMYFLGKELFGKTPGVVAAVLYLLAPYRALDSYVRGAVGESFALAIIPFVFYFYLRLIKIRNRKYFALAAISTFLFFVSHNIMTLIFTPLLIIWVIFWLYKTCLPAGREKWKSLKISLVSLGLAFGLAAFFVLPAYFEKGLVQTEALTRYELDFRAQFVKVSQLFIDRSWNYSGSQPQATNTISYQIGWPHWWLVVLSLFAIVISKKKKNILLFTFLFLTFSFGVFMTHNKSAPIWELVKILSYVQFPWRFLSIVIFSSSLIGGYFASFFTKKWLISVSAIIIGLTVILNWQYFKPEHFYYNLTDNELLSGQNFVDQQKGALLDYLPKTALEPRELPPKLDNFVNKSGSWKLIAKINKETVIEVPVFDFPGWVVYVDGKVVPHSNKNILGRINFSLPSGEHLINGKFTNTPVRTFGNILTLTSFIALVLIYAKSRKVFV